MLKFAKTTLSFAAILLLATACGKKASVKDETSALSDNYFNSSQSSESSAMSELSKDGINIVHFTYNSYDLSAKSKDMLKKQLATLKNYMNIKVLIAGHTDARGTYEYNLGLGERRAISVKNFLVSNGIEANRIEVTSFSSEKPLDNGNNEAAWAKNRRAETSVIGK
ncbi:MAG: OmpA family protein [Rickettsiaceae bacterium]|nr:OmpA family protein [Rickettsiaceae bacterium]